MKISIPGKQQRPATSDADEFAALLGASTVSEVRVTPETRGEQAPGVVLDIQDAPEAGDLLELRWEGDIIELVAAHTLAERLEKQGAGRDGGVWRLPTRRPTAGAARGLGDVFLEAIKQIRLEKLTAIAARELIGKLEVKRIPNPGVFRLAADGSVRERLEQVPASSHPSLILLHGTFCSTEASFADLFASRSWETLTASYGPRIFALEQHTVTTSPAANALDLVRALPEDAPLHLLSQSRGGLVGELLCRRWAPSTDGADAVGRFFAGDEYEQAREELRALESLMRSKRPKVERFVRVACPAAGTLLASERIDRYLSVFISLIGRVLGASGPVFSFAKALALAIVGSRAKPEHLPGLEAMMPHLKKGYVPFLNTSDPVPGDGLAVIAGDVQGGDFAQRLKAFFIDLYYREPNDFIIDSKSMFRGVPRIGGRSFYYRSPSANHFSYFRNPPTRDTMSAWLTSGDSPNLGPLEQGASGRLGARESRDIPKLGPAPPNAADRRPVVFLLPGIMGSRLNDGDDNVWVHVWRLARGGLSRLGLENAAVATHGLLDSPYEDLYHHVARDFRVEPFAYDWRKPLEDAAALLQAALEREFASHGRPVTLMAHSMGGLVSRTLIAKHPDTWQKLTLRGGRLVMLGTPNYGSYAPVQVFTEQHSLMKWLARIDWSNNLGQLTDIVRRYPGLLEMLPGRDDLRLLEVAGWQGPLARYRPDESALARAKALRELLSEKGIDAPHMVYVAGWAKATPGLVETHDGEPRFLFTGRGDGTVPWSLGLLPGVPAYFVKAEHGAIPAHRESFDGFVELLREGRTHLLSRTAPVVTRGDDVLFPAEDELAPDSARYYPVAEDLTRILFGAHDAQATEQEPLRLSVVAGNVREVQRPTLVGHYVGDGLWSVERTLDETRLGGALSRRYQLGGYAGPIESSVHEEGAIVVGLGQVGTLTSDGLKRSVRRGLIEYALWLCSCRPSPEQQLKLSSVLIGTHGGSSLGIDECVDAIARAALEANLQLERAKVEVRIADLQFIELYQDVASDAVRAIKRFAQRQAGSVVAEPVVEERSGALRSRPLSPYASGWARRISVKRTPEDDSVLRFSVASDQARVAPMERRVQWSLIEPLLSEVTSSAERNRAILFRSLVPWSLAEQTDQVTDTVLELDAGTAHVPWELLGPDNEEAFPLFVRAGLLRQLDTRHGRSEPRRSQERRALVIGEPAGVDPPLPGAFEEAQHVLSIFEREQRRPVASLREDVRAIYGKLLEGAYDIIHIAAHGEFDPDDPKQSGIVVSKDVRLGPSDLDGLNAVPNVVFLNCCHLAKGADGKESMLRAPGQLAAGLAEHLIEMGVRVVVAAGWAVNDHAAKVFAEAFYRELLRGLPLIDVVRVARQETFRVCAPHDYTWAAYQVYGDAGYVLPNADTQVRSATPLVDLVSRQEAADFAADLRSQAIYLSRSQQATSDAKAQGSGAGATSVHSHRKSAHGDLLASLFALEERSPRAWTEDGRVAYELGVTYAELGQLRDAIEHFRTALKSPEAPLRAAEQLANCESHLARALQLEGNLAESAALFESSLSRLDALVKLEPSVERLALLASTQKRWAFGLPGAGDAGPRRSALERALETYRQAARLGADHPDRYYPLINVAYLELMLDLHPDEKTLDEVERAVAELPELDGWARITLADVAALRFTAGHPDVSLAQVEERYEEALYGGLGATPKGRARYEQQLREVHQALPEGELSDRLQQVRQLVESL